MLKTDEKSLEETLALFDRDLLDLNLDNCEDERRHFLLVIKTVLAHDVCKHIKKLKWITQHYEKHHQHKNSNTASSRSIIHVDPPKFLDENTLTDMTLLLEEFVARYLELLEECLPDESKEKFRECKKLVISNECSDKDLKEAESYLMETAQEYGYLIIHGDLLKKGVQNIY